MASLSDLRKTVRRYINEEDVANSHFKEPELNDYLNQAVQFLGTQMEWPMQVAQATAITDQALYQLPDDFLSLVDVYFDNKKLTVLERADLSSINAQWQTAADGIPTVAYKADTATIGLYQAPDASQNGKIIQIQYISLPATLITDTDVPDLHSSFQICLPFYAAFICDYKLGNDKKSELHLSMYEQHRKALMSKIQKYSDDLLRFRWVG
jgi:hypothetical protein